MKPTVMAANQAQSNPATAAGNNVSPGGPGVNIPVNREYVSGGYGSPQQSAQFHSPQNAYGSPRQQQQHFQQHQQVPPNQQQQHFQVSGPQRLSVEGGGGRRRGWQTSGSGERSQGWRLARSNPTLQISPPPKSLDRIAGTYSYECHGFCCSLAVWQFKYSGDSRRGNSWFGIITVGIVA